MTNSATPTKKRSPANSTYSRSATQGMNNMPGNVITVGEPSLMGGEMDDEDERYISRLENTKYDPNGISSQYNSPSQQITQGYQPIQIYNHYFFINNNLYLIIQFNF